MIIHSSVLDVEDIRSFLKGKQGRTGRLVMMNDDPGNSYNVIIGKITFNLWELVDALNITGVPLDSNKNSETSPWYLTHFVPKEVSLRCPSGTHLAAFPYCGF